jgi:RimJ/RimL family protein N-acetyltransferase
MIYESGPWKDQLLRDGKILRRCPSPPRTPIAGHYCRIEPLESGHARALYDADAEDTGHRNWTYLSVEPPSDADSYQRWIASLARSLDPLFFAVIGESGRAEGLVNYMRITPAHGVVEIGHVHFSPRLQRTRAGTEAIFLMMRRVFDELGYRRCEWNCDSRNEPSRAAALRYGFSFEGTFRQAMVVKGRNRDSAWFSVIDGEWPRIRGATESWLAPDNFDASGRQRRRLAEFF